jgi:hypothetical protein
MANQLTDTNIQCSIDTDDKQTVLFAYPHNFGDEYVLPTIRLEIGALAAWTPVAVTTIKPYAAQQYPALFEQPTTDILTVLPERTFWEKATILHREANRPKGSNVPARYSRHYYDLYRMTQFEVKNKALADSALLEKVVAFKAKFYRCPWAKYEDAKLGTLKLMPAEWNIPILKDDYEHMKQMIFGDKPSFDTILFNLKKLEDEINGKI